MAPSQQTTSWEMWGKAERWAASVGVLGLSVASFQKVTGGSLSRVIVNSQLNNSHQPLWITFILLKEAR